MTRARSSLTLMPSTSRLRPRPAGVKPASAETVRRTLHRENLIAARKKRKKNPAKPRFFERADEVVLDRAENRHAAFGLGIHRCAGSNLAPTTCSACRSDSITPLTSYKSIVPEVAERFATEMTAKLSENARSALLDSVPLRRAGLPADVASAVLFLSSPASDYITGQVLSVCGGLYM